MFSLVNSAVNTTLSAFAAERRAAAPCCGAVAAGLTAVDRHLFPARRLAANPPLLRSNDGTDRRTDARPFHKDFAPHIMRTVPVSIRRSTVLTRNETGTEYAETVSTFNRKLTWIITLTDI